MTGNVVIIVISIIFLQNFGGDTLAVQAFRKPRRTEENSFKIE
jgi:hypothetical protein